MKFQFIPIRTRKLFSDVRSKYFSLKTKDDIFKFSFYLLMLVLLFALPFMSLDAGISQDEITRFENAEKVYQYYNNNNPAVFSTQTLPYQGQLPDNISYLLIKWLGIETPFSLQHILCSLFGWGTILITGLFLLKLFNWRAAFLGALLLFVSPRFLGQSFSNLIDIPLAFAYIWGIFQIYLFCSELPAIKWGRLIWLTCSFILAISISSAGFVLLFFFIAFVLLFFLFNNPSSKIFTKEYFIALGKISGILIGITLIVYLADLFYLPIHLRSYVVNPAHAISELKNIIPPSIQLFEGNLIHTEDLPHYYLPKYMFLTIPLIALIGFLIYILLFPFILKKTRPYEEFLILISFFFPLVSAIVLNIKPAHDWSMFLFIYPSFILISVIGIEGLLEKIDDKYTNTVIIGIIYLLTLMPLRHIIINHPVSYIYFNEISGGIHYAYGKYEMDYNEQINKRASARLIQYVTSENVRDFIGEDKIVVATNGNKACECFFAKDTAFIKLISPPVIGSDTEWDYFMLFHYHVSPNYAAMFLNLHKKVGELDIEGKPIVSFIRNKNQFEE